MKNGLIIAILGGLLVLVSSCSQVQMSPAYSMELEMLNQDAAEWNRRCRAGDDEACKIGLDQCSQRIELFVDALHGIDSRGGGPNP